MPTGIIPNTDIELNLLSGAHWSRTTIADGKWLNSNTIQPLFNNDCILASAIHDTSADLYNRIEESSGYLQNEVDKINYEIDTINAGSDVIDVVGTYQQLMEYTGWTTDNDVIKVLNDESNLGNQTYYRYIDPTLDSGTLNPDSANWVYLGDLSPYYNKTTIDAMSAYLYDYTTNASGNLHQEIVTTSGNLHDEIVNSSSYLYRYINTASGNLFQKIDNTSAFLNQEIESTSSYLNTYIETVSGNLYQDIYNTSSYLLGELETSALNLQNDIDYVSGQADYSAAYLYSLIHDTSGKTEVSGGTYVQVTKLPQKPDGMITYSADLYPDKIVDIEASGKHLTLVNSGNTSTFVSDASKIIFGSGNSPEDIKFSDIQNVGTLTSAVSNNVVLGVIPKEPGGTYKQLAFVSNKVNGTQSYGWQETSGFVRADIDQTSLLSDNEKKQARANIGIIEGDMLWAHWTNDSNWARVSTTYETTRTIWAKPEGSLSTTTYPYLKKGLYRFSAEIALSNANGSTVETYPTIDMYEVQLTYGSTTLRSHVFLFDRSIPGYAGRKYAQTYWFGGVFRLTGSGDIKFKIVNDSSSNQPADMKVSHLFVNWLGE